jgi:hypothetical protein
LGEKAFGKGQKKKREKKKRLGIGQSAVGD